MGRWRPPQPKSIPYITPEGMQALQSEQTQLWTRRKHVTQALAAAAAEGDRSENAEYIYRKKELREIDRRIRYLQKRLPDLKVVTQVSNPEQIFFGAWVTLETLEGEELRYRIVGGDEIDPSKHYISVDSPLAKALLKKRVDDEVHLQLGERSDDYLITDIAYTA